MKTNLKDLNKKYTNDKDLGEYMRHTYRNDLNIDSSMFKIIKETPNDFELGKTIRDLILNS